MKQLYFLKKRDFIFSNRLSALIFLFALTGSLLKAQTLCIPSSNCGASDVITYFQLNSISNPSGCGSGGYDNFRSTTTATTSLMQSVPYQVNVSYGYGSCGFAVWIDFDNDSTFSASEKVGYTPIIGAGAGSTTFTVNIPSNAALGTHVLRTRLIYQQDGASIDPCAATTYGEAEDYLVTIDPLAACSGSPIVNNVATSDLCTSITNFTLSLPNSTYATGIQYQWQSSPDGSNWLNYGTAVMDNKTYVIPSISSPTYFRCVATCTNAGFGSTSSNVLVHPTTVMNCHCKPQWTGFNIDCNSDRITSFSISNLINQQSTCMWPGYSDSTASQAQINLFQGWGYGLDLNTLVNTSNGYAALVGAWIDFDQNGVFDANEYTQVGLGQTGNYQASVNVPLNAVLGNTRMRIMMDANNANTGTTLNPCYANSGNLGQILDYRVVIAPPPMCSGTPTAGNAIATETLVCPNVPYTIDLTNSEVSSGLIYQWYSSPDNTTWAPIGSASSTTSLSIASQTATTYYQCAVTCTASAQTATSTPFVVTQKMQIDCNCIPDYINCGSGDNFTQIDFAGITDLPICNAGDNGYADRAGVATTATVTAGSTYTVNMNFGSGGNGPAFISCWIDENQNGMFEQNEQRVLGSSVSSPYSHTVTVPFTALGGLTRVRYKLETSWAGQLLQDPCTTKGSAGQNVDYYIAVIPAPLCSGAPNAGNATSSATNVCSNEPFTLDLINNNQDGGMLFQWQNSTDGSNWYNYGPLKTNVPLPTPGQTITTQYRCIVTCTASSLTSTSTPVTVTQNAPTACYCIPSPINCNNNYITNVIFETIHDTISCGAGINGYNDNTLSVAAAAITASQVYTISVNVTEQFGNSYVGVWIDYNQNGIFDTYEEYTLLGSTSVSGPVTGTISVPFSAIGGTTRMRVKMENVGFSTFGGLDPCLNNQTEGQTIDYVLNVTPSPACSGSSAPNAGDTDASSLAVCLNESLSFTLINNDHLSNLSYQWQSSTDNVNWVNIGAAQMMVPYCIAGQTVTTHYRCVVTCLTGALSSTSTPVTVTQNPLTLCYCIPPIASCSTNDEINHVTFATLDNVSACSTDGYQDFASTVASTTVQAGQTYSINVVVGSDYYGHVSAWIDYNQNGVFDTTEYRNLGVTNSIGNYTVSNNIAIPTTAIPGITKMRLRNNRAFTFANNEACADGGMPGKLIAPTNMLGNGETEDYLVTILPPDCGTVTFPTSFSATSNSTLTCIGSNFVLNIDSMMPNAAGISYQWKSSIDGTNYFNLGSIQSTPILTVSTLQSTYYICDVLCNSSTIRSSNNVFITIDNISGTVTTTNVSCFGGSNGAVSVITAGGVSPYLYTWSPIVTSGSTVTSLIAGNYVCVITDALGCRDTVSATVTEPTAFTANITNLNNVSCFGGNNGNADITAMGGTTPYSYTWSPTGGNGAQAFNLSAGNYTCMMADVKGCTASQLVTITQPAAINATTSQTNVTCFGGNNGVASVTPMGGTGGYSYFWSNGFGAAGNTISGNVPAGSYTCTITDANNCTLDQVITLTQGSAININIIGNFNLCEFSSTTYTANVTNAVGSLTYTWSSQPSGVTGNLSTFDYTAPAASTETLYTSVTDANGCTQTTAGILINITSSKSISGTVLTATTGAVVSGSVILYKYEPFFTKFDSISTLTLNASGGYTFSSVPEATYIVKAVPSTSSLQITYGNSEINWKTAHQVSHGCATDAVENVNVIPLETFTPGSGVLKGRVYAGLGYGHKTHTNTGDPFKTMGLPVKGVIVKGGRNPGANTLRQATTNDSGRYVLDNLPTCGPDTSYFILVDIPGLDTNHTYHVVITNINSEFDNLDFIVDSVQINPISAVKVNEIEAKDFNLMVYPNPTQSQLNINFNLKSESKVQIKLYDVIGKEMKTIINPSNFESGDYSFRANISELATGMYFMKLNINSREITVKIIKE